MGLSWYKHNMPLAIAALQPAKDYYYWYVLWQRWLSETRHEFSLLINQLIAQPYSKLIRACTWCMEITVH